MTIDYHAAESRHYMREKKMSNDSMNINDLENEAALIEHVSKSAEVTVEQMGVDVDALRADVDMMRAELNELRAVVNQFSHPSTWGN